MGRSLNETDIRDRRKVCVIGKRIYETLFPKKDNPCGQFIEINGIYYRVVGVNEATGNMSVNGQSETSVVIPFTTMQQNYNRGKQIDMLGYTAKKGYSISQVEKQVEYISFSMNICEQLARLTPKSEIAYLKSDIAPKDVKAKGANGIDYHYKAFEKHPEWVKEAHELGMKVNVWTVNNEKDMKKMIDLNVDYITTDQPLEAAALVAGK
jgi:hypothetical protein